MFGFDDSFFGNDYQDNEPQIPKGNDVVVDLEATLEDLYNGRVFKIQRDKNKAVETSGTRQCNCRQQMVTQQLGPGMFQQYTKMVCDDCPNKKFVREIQEMEIEIEPGFKEGEEIVKFGEGEPHIDGEHGDLKFIIKQMPHSRYTRDGNHLHYALNISLRDALLGFKKQIRHLDNRLVNIQANKVTIPGEIIILKQQGMPIYSEDFGDLFVHIKVDFPTDLSQQQIECIQNNFQ